MMKRSIAAAGMGILSLAVLSTRPAFAETIELVTYYPAPGGDQGEFQRFHTGSGTVGAPFSPTNPINLPDGTLLVADRLAVGTAAPAGPLHVVGRNDSIESVLFLPGNDTVAAGTPEIRVGIGTAAPAGLLHAVGAPDAVSNVLFMPGPDNAGNPGVPEIRVGIGTAAPTERLQVVGGNIVAGDTAANQPNIRVGSTGIQGRSGLNPSDLLLNSLGGNVGIGTNAPNAAASPGNGVAAGNLDVNDLFIRSMGLWASQTRPPRLSFTTMDPGSGRYSNSIWIPALALNVTVRPGGGSVLILGECYFTTGAITYPSDGLAIVRDGIYLGYSLTTFGTPGGSGWHGNLTVMAAEQLPAGTYTYQLQVYTNSAAPDYHYVQKAWLCAVDF